MPNLTPSNNTFKNSSVQRAELSLPSSLSAGAEHTDSEVFTLSENISLIECYAYTTDYDEYFRHLDSSYHDSWRPINSSRVHLVLDSPVTTLSEYELDYFIDGDEVTVRLYMKNRTAGSLTYTPNKTAPIVFVEYTLAY
jgi:hypothetical protein